MYVRVGIKGEKCEIPLILPFLGDLRHFWVKVDKLYHFGRKLKFRHFKCFSVKVMFLWLDLYGI